MQQLSPRPPIRSSVRATAGRVSNPGGRAGLGVFGDNRRRPVHRWYPFAEAFSSELISEALAGRSASALVFDPFGGSGTTALAAAELGFDSVFTEANPYLAWLALVKVNAVNGQGDVSRSASGLIALAAQVETGAVVAAPRPEHLVINEKRSFLPDEALCTVSGVLAAAEDLDPALRDLVRLAVAVSLIPASNMIRRTDLRRRTAGDPPPEEARKLIAAKLREIGTDLLAVDPVGRGRTTLLGTDAKSFKPANQPFDAIITSPPYLNGTNYCRNTKLELLLLGFISNEQELNGLRDMSIAAGINNISKRRAAPTQIDAVEEVAVTLDDVAYDRRIPALVRGYFSDMRQALLRMRVAASGDCTLLLDIGDSRYSGVHVDTPRLLASIGEEVGWKLVDRRQLRARRSHDGTALTQDLLSLAALPA